ncbi:MAG: MipA/OmpV family protein [Alphaproteobacteria bacterium]
MFFLYAVEASAASSRGRVFRRMYAGRSGGSSSASSGNWSSTIGLGFGWVPKWEGDDQSHGVFLPFSELPLPYFDFRWRNRLFLTSREGLGINLFRKKTFTLGVAAQYMPGRAEDLSINLDGMGDVEPAIGAHVFMDMRMANWFLRFSGLKALTGDEDDPTTQTGTIAEFSLARMFAVDNETRFIIAAKTHWADEAYLQTFFGVTPEQAESVRQRVRRCGEYFVCFTVEDEMINPIFVAGTVKDYIPEKEPLPVYYEDDIDAGIKDASIELKIRRKFGESITLSIFAEYKKLLGTAASSPLILQRGDAVQTSVGTYLNYHF